MKKFLLLVCIFVCATRVYCAATDDKYGWFTRLGMYLTKSPQRIAKELRKQRLYTHLLIKKSSENSEYPRKSNGYHLYHFFENSNVGISKRMIVEQYGTVDVEESSGFYIVNPKEFQENSSLIISTIALYYPQKFISFLREVFSEKDSTLDDFSKSNSWAEICRKKKIDTLDYSAQQQIISENNKKCNSIIDKELSRATQCGVAATVGVAAAGAALYGLYFLRNEIATGVKNGTSSLVAAVASGLGK